MTDENQSEAAVPAAPTFDGLTPMQGRFVVSYLELGRQKGGATEAALAAGYGGGTNRQAAKARACELLRHEGVLKAIRTEITRTLSAASVVALDTLVELAREGPPQVRLSASKEILDRSIGPIASRFAHVHAQARSIDDIIMELEGQGRREGDVVDAQFVVLPRGE